MKKNSFNTKIIGIVIFIAYFVFNFILLKRHEMWRDESQPWGIAAYASLPDMIHQLKVEGCPILWFIFQRMLSFLGIRFSMMGYATLLLTTIAGYILLFKVNTSFVIKIAWMCSSLFNYYNPVIARNYALVLLLVILIIYVWNDRNIKKWYYALLISLLIQTNVFTLGFCLGLIIDIIYRGLKLQDKSVLVTGIIPIFSMFLCFVELVRFTGMKTYINWSPAMIVNNSLNFNKNFRLVMYSINCLFDANLGFSLALVILLSILVFYILYIVLIEKKMSIIVIFILSNLCTYFMFILIKEGGGPLNNIVCCFLVFIASLYIIYCGIENKNCKIILLIVLTLLPILTFGKMFVDAVQDFKYDYSGSKRLALYIKDNIPKDSAILYDVCAQISPVLAYVQEFRPDIQNYDIVNKDELIFHVWDKEYQKDVDETEFSEYINELSNKHKNIYYIDAFDRLSFNNFNILKDFRTNEYAIVYDEKFKIYEVN